MSIWGKERQAEREGKSKDRALEDRAVARLAVPACSEDKEKEGQERWENIQTEG